MNKLVWKYPLEMLEMQTIQIPAGAKLLHVDTQGTERPVLWAAVNPDMPMENRRFVVVGTGHLEIPKDCVYVGTAVGPVYVWHVFEDI